VEIKKFTTNNKSETGNIPAKKRKEKRDIIKKVKHA